METLPLSSHCTHEEFQVPFFGLVGQNASVLIVLLCSMTCRHSGVTGC